MYESLVLSFDGGPVHAGASGGGRAIASWGYSEYCLHHSVRLIQAKSKVDVLVWTPLDQSDVDVLVWTPPDHSNVHVLVWTLLDQSNVDVLIWTPPDQSNVYVLVWTPADQSDVYVLVWTPPGHQACISHAAA